METEAKTLKCDMVAGCSGEVTHVDRRGFLYCAPHGHQRRAGQACRKLRPSEINKLRRSETIRY